MKEFYEMWFKDLTKEEADLLRDWILFNTEVPEFLNRREAA